MDPAHGEFRYEEMEGLSMIEYFSKGKSSKARQATILRNSDSRWSGTGGLTKTMPRECLLPVDQFLHQRDHQLFPDP